MDRPTSPKTLKKSYARYQREDGKPGYSFECDRYGNPVLVDQKTWGEFLMCARGFDVDGVALLGPSIFEVQEPPNVSTT